LTNSSTKRSLVPRLSPVRGEALQSRPSSGLRRKSEAASVKPACSTSARSVDSSMRCRVSTSFAPLPAFALWSTMPYTPPGLSARNTAAFIFARSTFCQ
jgi:hypothetical protein